MRINLIEVLTNDSYELPFDVSGEIEDIIFGGAKYSFKKPVSVSGSVVKQSGDMSVGALIRGRLTTECARCGHETEYPFNIEVAEKIVENNDEDGITLHGTFLDLHEFMVTSVVSEIPIQILCSEDCRGVCFECGANLNNAECTCKEVDSGPMQDMIKNLNWKDEV